MATDADMTAGFYGTARGTVAAQLLRQRLGALWPDARGHAVLGIGYTAPYLRLWPTTPSLAATRGP